jgi:hypothetical protein
LTANRNEEEDFKDNEMDFLDAEVADECDKSIYSDADKKLKRLKKIKNKRERTRSRDPNYR